MSDFADEGSRLTQLAIDDALARHRVRAQGGGATRCEDCDEPIPEGRRRVLPEAVRCVDCQEARELNREDLGA